ncbi:MAG: hypothetical protein KDB27_14710, partial [Planctomycetales bacterium]|nr:hypothetical protein [Planctomycetales bacterium]
MLAADVGVVVGDSNLDGKFDSTDLVAVFTVGKFETGEAATHAEGDWNSDGFFNSTDFVAAFQANSYQRNRLAAEPTENQDGEDENGRDEASIEQYLQGIVEKLEAKLAELEEDTQSLQERIDAAKAALEAGDLDAVREALGHVIGKHHGSREGDDDGPRGENETDDHDGDHDENDRDDDQDSERPSTEERLTQAIDALQARIDAGELPDGADAAAIQAGIDAAKAALEAGDVDAALEAFRAALPDRGERPDDGDDQVTPEERIQNAIDALQARVDAGLPEGVDAAAVQAGIDTAKTELAAGNLDA